MYRLLLVQRRQHVFLAPPYHPCFSYLNMFSTICRKTDITMHTSCVLIYFWICLCTLVPLIVYVLDILERTRSPLSFCNPHFDDDPCTISLPVKSTPITLHTHPIILINHLFVYPDKKYIMGPDQKSPVCIFAAVKRHYGPQPKI